MLVSLSESWDCFATYSSLSWRRSPCRRSSSEVRIRLFSISMSCWWRMPERWPFFSSPSCMRAKSWSRAPSVSWLCCLISVSIFSSWAFQVAISIAMFVRSMVSVRIWSDNSATFVSARFESTYTRLMTSRLASFSFFSRAMVCSANLMPPFASSSSAISFRYSDPLFLLIRSSISLRSALR